MAHLPPEPAPTTACIALGSNLGDREATIRAAIAALAALPRTTLAAASSLHETAPVGPVVQGLFLNAAVRVRTALEPRELLHHLQRIERDHGRDRLNAQRWGPRTLDLDLLLYGDRTIEEDGLTVPHPRMHERLFVLEPLSEVAPDFCVPTIGSTVLELRDALRAAVAPLPPR